MSPNQQLREALRLAFGREQYEFHGRETHMGQDYLIFKLVANPWPGHAVGKRWARLA
jgi:hypothetical protein